MSPLVFVDKLGTVDVEGTVQGVGDGAKAGAVRLALSLALAAFEDENTRERMRQGMLVMSDCIQVLVRLIYTQLGLVMCMGTRCENKEFNLTRLFNLPIKKFQTKYSQN